MWTRWMLVGGVSLVFLPRAEPEEPKEAARAVADYVKVELKGRFYQSSQPLWLKPISPTVSVDGFSLFELEFPKGKELQKEMEKSLNGKTVIVTGTLEFRPGERLQHGFGLAPVTYQIIEPDRYIVRVTNLRAAETK